MGWHQKLLKKPWAKQSKRARILRSAGYPRQRCGTLYAHVDCNKSSNDDHNKLRAATTTTTTNQRAATTTTTNQEQQRRPQQKKTRIRAATLHITTCMCHSQSLSKLILSRPEVVSSITAASASKAAKASRASRPCAIPKTHQN